MTTAMSIPASRGFTMIELVTVMVVIGILAIFALSRLDFTDTFEQRGGYDKIKAGLQFARKAAVAHRRFTCATLGSHEVSFTLDPAVPDGRTPVCGATALNLPARDARDCAAPAANKLCVPAVATLSSSTTTIVFDALGAYNGGSSATITLNGFPTPITVEAVTGYVH